MGVDEDRRATARDRRRIVLEAFTRHLAPSREGLSAADRLRVRLHEDVDRVVVAGLDVDGLVSAAMLAGSSSWRVGVLVDRSSRLLVHPDLDWDALVGEAEDRLFGVDVFSLLFPSVSNHPVLFGDLLKRPPALRQRYRAWDEEVTDRVAQLGSVNPSAWAGIGASLGSGHPRGLPYKYPLGTAQILLATLEVAGAQPRLFDRQYLPWIIANADGGATSIRQYAWNAELWWSAMAAAVGPASNSEAIYRLVSQQRPSEFLEADRRLRWEEPDRSRALKATWNLVSSSSGHITDVVGMLTSWSGWPDPFLGGVDSVPNWVEVQSTGGVLPVKGMTKERAEVVDAHLGAARRAVHVNFSTYREQGPRLGWLGPGRVEDVESVVGTVEALPTDDDPSVPDID